MRWRRRHFSAAAQELFGGDGMVEVDDATLQRQWQAGFDTFMRTEEARRIILLGQLTALQTPRPSRRGGRPKGMPWRPESKKWTADKLATLQVLVQDIRKKRPTWKTSQVSAHLAKLGVTGPRGRPLAKRTIDGLLTKRPKK